MKKLYTLLMVLVMLPMHSSVVATEVIYSDNFTYQTNWTVSSSGGTVSFATPNVLQLTANASGTVGRQSALPSSTFHADSVDVYFEFNSSLLGFQAILGTTPNRIQILRESPALTSLRLSGEATSSVTNGAKFIAVSKNAWHTMKVKYRKTATTKTATFILDEGTAGVLTQTVDLSLQAATYEFVLNRIDFRGLNGEVVQIRNVQISGVRPEGEMLYNDNFSFMNNWVASSPENGSLSFNEDPENTGNNIMQLNHTANEYPVSSFLPTFNFTGTSYLVSYKFRTQNNKSNFMLGTSPKSLAINSEYTAGAYRQRFSGQVTTISEGAMFLDKATFNEWHRVDVRYNTTNRTAQFTVDGDKPSHGTVTVNLNSQAAPYDFVLNAMQVKALLDDVVEIKDFAVYGTGSTSPVITKAISEISSTYATANGLMTNLGEAFPTEYGHCWSTTPNPTIADIKTTLGTASATGTFTSEMIGLASNTTYYVKAYAINANGTTYGSEVSFTTELGTSVNFLDQASFVTLNGRELSFTGVIGQVEIYNVAGSLVTSQKPVNSRIILKSAGVYILKMNTSQGFQNQKFIVY
jgi:hypothetical protein